MSRSWSRVLLLLSAVVVLSFANSALCQESTPSAPSSLSVSPDEAYKSNPKFKEAMDSAVLYVTRQQLALAIEEYQKADKIAGGNCDACFKNIYNLASEIGDYKRAALAAADRAAHTTDPKTRAEFEVKQASMLYTSLGEKPKPAKLAPLDDLLKSAVRDDPKNVTALYLQGKVLAQLGQLDAAKAAFQQCAQCDSPKDPMLGRIRRFAAEPELSYQKRAPAFTVTALDGSKFTLDDMNGRVVLIDFWATWCGPCREELPEMKHIAKEFAGQPLVIISISWDSDDAKWKDFVAKNGMTWAQFRDADHKLTDKFGIDAIPHYFTIDSDGVLTSEMLGSGSDVEGKLKKLIARAKAEQATSESASSQAQRTSGE